MKAFDAHAQTQLEQSVIWRRSVLCWAGWHGMNIEGDFVECACYMGTAARIVCDYVELGKSEKHYYLYDLFEHTEEMEHHSLSEHGAGLYEQVKQRFSDIERVVVTQGSVPQILQSVVPEKVAFLHLDLNNAEAELGTMELLYDRITPGGIIVLDDYGWLGYRDQKLALDPFFEARGHKVLELPTGQGLVIKH